MNKLKRHHVSFLCSIPVFSHLLPCSTVRWLGYHDWEWVGVAVLFLSVCMFVLHSKMRAYGIAGAQKSMMDNMRSPLFPSHPLSVYSKWWSWTDTSSHYPIYLDTVSCPPFVPSSDPTKSGSGMNSWIYSLVAGAVFLIKFTHLTSWLVRTEKETMALYKKNITPPVVFHLFLFHFTKNQNRKHVAGLLYLTSGTSLAQTLLCARWSSSSGGGGCYHRYVCRGGGVVVWS